MKQYSTSIAFAFSRLKSKRITDVVARSVDQIKLQYVVKNVEQWVFFAHFFFFFMTMFEDHYLNLFTFGRLSA